MKKIFYFVLLAFVIVGGSLMAQLTNRVSSQEVVSRPPDGLETLRNKSLRKTDPQKVIDAIGEVTAPFRARPVTSTDAPPAEIMEALVDLLDFERPKNEKNLEFDPSEGTKVYPVMRSLFFMRKPVLPFLVDVLENEDSKSVKSQNALRVIRDILEADDTKTFNYLQVQAGSAKSEAGKQRVLSAANNILKEQKKP
jgi:hypothetical protein